MLENGQIRAQADLVIRVSIFTDAMGDLQWRRKSIGFIIHSNDSHTGLTTSISRKFAGGAYASSSVWRLVWSLWVAAALISSDGSKNGLNGLKR